MVDDYLLHWAIQIDDPKQYPTCWITCQGDYFVQACGREPSGVVVGSAGMFVILASVIPSYYCSDCVEAARLSLPVPQRAECLAINCSPTAA